MSQRYLERRYLQIRIILVASALCLIAQGIIWLSGVMKAVESTWVKWHFHGAAALFVFTIYDFFMPVLEVKVAIDEKRHLWPAEKEVLDKIFYTGVIVFALASGALLFVLYKLISQTR